MIFFDQLKREDPQLRLLTIAVFAVCNLTASAACAGAAAPSPRAAVPKDVRAPAISWSSAGSLESRYSLRVARSCQNVLAACPARSACRRALSASPESPAADEERHRATPATIENKTTSATDATTIWRAGPAGILVRIKAVLFGQRVDGFPIGIHPNAHENSTANAQGRVKEPVPATDTAGDGCSQEGAGRARRR